MEKSPTPVILPLVNPNEPEAVLAGLNVQPGQKVIVGEVLCTLETTKATAEVSAEVDGYVVGLRYREGQTAPAGEILCYLAASPEEPAPTPAAETGGETAGELPAGLRISQPALALARQGGLDLARLPVGPLVTERDVRALLDRVAGTAFSPPSSEFDPTAILIFGGGGHGKSLIELLRALGSYRLAGVVDDRLAPGEDVLGVPVLGGSAALGELRTRGLRLAVNAVGGIGNVAVRVQVFERLAAAGFVCPAVVHPRALVEPSAQLAPGVQVFAHAYVGSAAQVGFGAIVNTGAILSHDCRLGDYVNLSPGAILAGGVQVGSGSLVGMGVTINLEVKIGAGARIGNGATVKADVPERGVVRAGGTWPE